MKIKDALLLADGGSFRVRATIDVPIMEATVVPRLKWLHGEAACPSCGLPIGPRDVDEELRGPGSAQPVGAIVTHRRCGATFRLEFSG